MAIRLHVNVDHVATLRQQRHTRYPDPVFAAQQAELAGAHGITVHLREDRRHIQERDVLLLRETVQTCLNLEMAVTKEMQEIALRVIPDIVTLVPEKRQELTTEGGLNVVALEQELSVFLPALLKKKIECSLFIDPSEDQVEASARLGVSIVELSTASFTEAKSKKEQHFELQRLKVAASFAHSLGLKVAGGHGLDYHNVKALLSIPEMEELNIGHSIVSHAVFVGFPQAVKEMLLLLGNHVC